MERLNYETPNKEREVITSSSSERFVDRVEETRQRIILLNSLVKKVNFYSSDESDEFTIEREDGSVEGIFKTWAVPVIPFLEEEKEEELARELITSGADFNATLSSSALESIKDWSQSIENSQRKLEQVLENWRAFSEIHDRRLTTVFNSRELPASKVDRVAELVLRLQTAFAFSAPFYNLEAMIAENQDTDHNPILRSDENCGGEQEFLGGQLDLVAIALPSALRDKVVSEQLEWNGLSWDIINDMIDLKNPDEETIIAMRLAHRIGVDPKDVLFAANVLQWIPTSVGGKKDDFKQQEAMTILLRAATPQKTSNNIEVARDMNALIRLLNWMPLERSDDNFANGTGWRYAAVCDTANKLLREISEGGVLIGDFEDVFIKKIEPQLSNLDATSAKGRFILSLIQEGRFKPEVERAIGERQERFLNEVSRGLTIIEQDEEVVPLVSDFPRVSVGGKAMGLKEAQLIFGKDKVLPGFVITSEAINRWLKSNKHLWGSIQRLEKEDHINEKLAIAREVRQAIFANDVEDSFIDRLNIPSEWDMLAIRSSSSDEDTINNGAAAGIYESAVGVEKEDLDTPIRKVVASIFGDKAVSYRFLEGLQDTPRLAIIISPFIEGCGGAIFSNGDGNGWEAVVGATPQSIVSAESQEFDTFRKSRGEVTSDIKIGFIEDSKIDEVGLLVERAELFLGTKVDMEFIVNRETGKVTVLQLRSLDSKQTSTQETQTNMTPNMLRIDNLGEMANIDLGNQPTSISLGGNINLDQFQGELFRFLVKNRKVVTSVVLPRKIPTTSHFANICGSLGITIQTKET